METTWSPWSNLDKTPLLVEVSFTFPYDWEPHEAEFRLTNGTIIQGQIWPQDEPFSYIDSDGNEEFDSSKQWYVEDSDGNSIPEDSIVAWRYKL